MRGKSKEKASYTMTDQSKSKLTGITPVRNPFLDYQDDDLGRAKNYIKHVKGEFRDQDKQPIEIGTQFVAAMDSLSTGFGCWSNNKLTKRLRPIICPPKLCRNDLPDNDCDLWELGDNGKPKDPWGAMSSLLLADPATGKVYVFETTARGGRVGLDDLRVAYGRVLHLHPNEHPIIELGLSSYEGKKGLVHEPTFRIVGWISKDADGLGALDTPPPAPAPAVPKPIAAPAPDLCEPPEYEADDPGPGFDDEIPF
jgi:hypothetical protein